jgi:hypothetical protein
MLEILLAVKDYLTDRNIPTRAFKHEVDIEDELEWLVYDNDFMLSGKLDEIDVSLLAQYGRYSVTIELHTDIEGPEEQLYLTADKMIISSTKHRFIKAAKFNLHNVEFLQKIYEFIISKH